MGCHLSRTTSTEDLQKATESTTPVTEASSKKVSSRVPLPELKNGQNGNLLQIAGKPIVEVESASQVDFFRMLDDKINRGTDGDEIKES